MRPEDEPDPVNLDEWALTQETVSALLYEALRQPEIQAALAESDLTELEAGQAVLDEAALRDTKVETLATVRQQMAVDSRVARRLLVTFRKDHGLELDS